MHDRRDLTAFEGIPGTRFKIRDVTSDHKYLHKWSLQAQEAAKKLVICRLFLFTRRDLIAQGKGKDEEAEKVLRDARVVIGDDKVDAILMLSQLRQLRKQVQRRLAMTRAHYGLSDWVNFSRTPTDLCRAFIRSRVGMARCSTTMTTT